MDTQWAVLKAGCIGLFDSVCLLVCLFVCLLFVFCFLFRKHAASGLPTVTSVPVDSSESSLYADRFLASGLIRPLVTSIHGNLSSCSLVWYITYLTYWSVCTYLGYFCFLWTIRVLACLYCIIVIVHLVSGADINNRYNRHPPGLEDNGIRVLNSSYCATASVVAENLQRADCRSMTKPTDRNKIKTIQRAIFNRHVCKKFFLIYLKAMKTRIQRVCCHFLPGNQYQWRDEQGGDV